LPKSKVDTFKSGTNSDESSTAQYTSSNKQQLISTSDDNECDKSHFQLE